MPSCFFNRGLIIDHLDHKSSQNTFNGEQETLLFALQLCSLFLQIAGVNFLLL